MPMTRGGGCRSIGTARIRRSSVSPLTGMASRPRQAGSGLTAGMQGDAALRLGEPDGAPNPRQGHRRQAFGEDPARAFGSGAAKATDLKIEMTDPSLPGEIPEMANIAAVNAARRRRHKGQDAVPARA